MRQASAGRNLNRRVLAVLTAKVENKLLLVLLKAIDVRIREFVLVRTQLG